MAPVDQSVPSWNTGAWNNAMNQMAANDGHMAPPASQAAGAASSLPALQMTLVMHVCDVTFSNLSLVILESGILPIHWKHWKHKTPTRCIRHAA